MPAAPASRLPQLLLAVFVLFWAVLAWRPSYRQDWLLENLLVFVGVPLLVANHRRLRFSDATYVLLFVFLCLHEVGAHYTYAEVPIGYGWFGPTRNHFDRLVHFSFGLLLLPMVVEIFQARAHLQGLWRYLVPVTFVMACSESFELIEWQAAEIFGGPLGQAYLGTQGDVWDAQKDSAMALLGALLSLTVLQLLRRLRPWGLPAP